jgi:DNA-binding MarR family transcriptional regulator
MRIHHMSKPSPEDACLICAAGTLRRATRSVSRLYDSRLARAGLTTTQFSILRSLERHATAVPLSQLAEEQVFERTSLYRALKPLCRDGLVKMGAEDGRRAKDVSLTARGRQRIARALPHWQEAQDEFLAHFGRSAWSNLSEQLMAIVDAARG